MNKAMIIKKAVIKSMSPENCEKIINEECFEIQSAKAPREIRTPFKCYIYCQKKGNYLIRQSDNLILNGTIIGEFICSKIKKNNSEKLLIPLNLKFYDKPKRLSDFKIIRGTLKNFCYVEELEEVNKADGLKQLCRNMFLYFPWLMFEREIEHSIIDGRIFDLATCKDYIAKIETAFNDGMHDLYGYDTKKYGTTCNNGISENKLFQVLVDYAKLHFIYFCQSYGVKNEN